MQPWYYLHNGVSYGPVTFEQLQKFALDGHLHPVNNQVWNPSMAAWAESGKIEHLFPVKTTPVAVQASPQYQAVAQPQQQYTPAAVAQPQQQYTPAAIAQPQQQYTPAAVAQPQQQYTPAAVAQPQQQYTPAAVAQPQQQPAQHFSAQPLVAEAGRPSVRTEAIASSATAIRSQVMTNLTNAGNAIASSGEGRSSDARDISPGSDPIDAIACIKKSWQLVKNNFMPLVIAWVICCVVYVVLGVVLGILTSIVIKMTAGTMFVAVPVLLTSFVYSLISSFLVLGFMRMSLNLVDQKPITFMQVFSQLGKVFRVFCGYPLWSLLVTFLPIVAALLLPNSLSSMIGLGGNLLSLAFLVFGIFFLLKYGQYAIAIVDRNYGLVEAIKYSGKITENNKKNLFILGLISIILFPLALVAFAVAYRWMQRGHKVAIA